MIKRLFFSIALFFAYLLSFGGSCNYDMLSNQFDFELSREGTNTSGQIVVKIYSKDLRVITQQIQLDIKSLPEKVFLDCNAVRSYQTTYNCTNGVERNDFGDFIVADFNFDGKDDFAVKTSFSEFNEPVYTFFVQDSKDWFVKDAFLTDEMKFFPNSRSFKERILITKTYATNETCLEKKYKLSKKNKWKLKGQQVVQK